MRYSEQRRAWVGTRVLGGEVTVAEAAELLALSERSIHRLRTRLEQDGPAGLVYGNRGRPSMRRLPDATRDRIVALATTYKPNHPFTESSPAPSSTRGSWQSERAGQIH